jgi:hypothetical protein
MDETVFRGTGIHPSIVYQEVLQDSPAVDRTVSLRPAVSRSLTDSLDGSASIGGLVHRFGEGGGLKTQGRLTVRKDLESHAWPVEEPLEEIAEPPNLFLVALDGRSIESSAQR